MSFPIEFTLSNHRRLAERLGQGRFPPSHTKMAQIQEALFLNWVAQRSKTTLCANQLDPKLVECLEEFYRENSEFRDRTEQKSGELKCLSEPDGILTPAARMYLDEIVRPTIPKQWVKEETAYVALNVFRKGGDNLKLETFRELGILHDLIKQAVRCAYGEPVRECSPRMMEYFGQLLVVCERRQSKTKELASLLAKPDDSFLSRQVAHYENFFGG